MKNFILFIALFTSSIIMSCAHKSSAPIIQKEFKVDTVYQHLIDKVFTPIDRIVYSDCNDTAYLMTIASLNRKLDSSKSVKESKSIISQTRKILDDRNDRELKEQKQANKSLIEVLRSRDVQVEELTDQLAAMEKTRRVDIRQQSSSCAWWHLPVILLLLALLFLSFLLGIKKPI